MVTVVTLVGTRQSRSKCQQSKEASLVSLEPPTKRKVHNTESDIQKGTTEIASTLVPERLSIKNKML